MRVAIVAIVLLSGCLIPQFGDADDEAGPASLLELLPDATAHLLNATNSSGPGFVFGTDPHLIGARAMAGPADWTAVREALGRDEARFVHPFYRTLSFVSITGAYFPEDLQAVFPVDGRMPSWEFDWVLDHGDEWGKVGTGWSMHRGNTGFSGGGTPRCDAPEPRVPAIDSTDALGIALEQQPFATTQAALPDGELLIRYVSPDGEWHNRGAGMCAASGPATWSVYWLDVDQMLQDGTPFARVDLASDGTVLAAVAGEAPMPSDLAWEALVSGPHSFDGDAVTFEVSGAPFALSVSITGSDPIDDGDTFTLIDPVGNEWVGERLNHHATDPTVGTWTIRHSDHGTVPTPEPRTVTVEVLR